MQPFECIGPNGQTYLHNDNWAKFVKEKYKDHSHNWLHRRGIIGLHSPADENGLSAAKIMSYQDDFRVIFEPYPAHYRHEGDPDALQPSFHIFVEDNQKEGEQVVLFGSSLQFFGYNAIRYVLFRGKYWSVFHAIGGNIGLSRPPATPKKSKSVLRSLDDDWNCL